MGNLFFERLAKVGKAKLRNGNEYKWSANVYNPGTGEFTICGYWKGLTTWHFIAHREDGRTWEKEGVEGIGDIILEEPEQWVNIITQQRIAYLGHSIPETTTYASSKIFPSIEYASAFQKEILQDPMVISVTAKKLV